MELDLEADGEALSAVSIWLLAGTIALGLVTLAYAGWLSWSV